MNRKSGLQVIFDQFVALSLQLALMKLRWAVEHPDMAAEDPLVRVAFAKGLEQLPRDKMLFRHDVPQSLGITGYDPSRI